MSKKRWSVLGLALGALVLGVLVGLMTVGTVAADPSPGIRVQIPRVDIGDIGYGTGDWETWIQVQNVSHDVDTGAVFFGWREADEPSLCPPNDDGPFVVYCQLVRGNAIWTLLSQLDEEIFSGVIYSVREDVFQDACDDAASVDWSEWEKEWRTGNGVDSADDPMTWGPAQGENKGEELAVTVNRYGENVFGTFVSSAYTGISDEMEGVDAPGTPPYEYYAPYVMHGYNGLDTELTIQNSGDACTSVWIDYLEQGSCGIVWKEHIEQLAPGEAIRVRVPKEVNPFDPDGCYWLGSAHVTAEQPLGVIVDETTFDEPCANTDPGTLLTHRARAHKEMRDGEEVLDTKVYADLIFREWSGWDASIQVQNLSRTGQHTFVTVSFMDNSGDEILFLADWVCPTGSATFYLPIVNSLGFDYVGAAEIESHNQVNYPGDETPAQPIFAVVDLKKPDDPLTTAFDPQGGSYNAHPYSQKEWVDEIALPFMAKVAPDMYTPWSSMLAIRNNSNCNKIRPKVWFKDETGRLICEINSIWLRPKHMTMIDLQNLGCLYPGYIGAAKVVIEPEDVEQLCDQDNDGQVDNLPTMPSVIVVEKGIIGYGGVVSGDVTKIYEGIPYSTGDKLCDADLLGTVIDSETLKPIVGATITVPNGHATYNSDTREWEYTDAVGTTGPGGMFEIEEIVTFGTLEPAGTSYTVTVEATDYYSSTIPDVYLSCGEDQVLNVALVSECENVTLNVYVEDKETGLPITGLTNANIEVSNPKMGGSFATVASGDAAGEYNVTGIAFDADDLTQVVVAITGYNRSYDTVFFPACGTEVNLTVQLHQTPMSRVLLYYGNGGDAPVVEALPNDSAHEYYNVQVVLEYLRYQVDYTDVWPSDPDLEEYRAIFLLGPGNAAGDTPHDYFTPGQKAQLDLFLRNGGRLVVMTDAAELVIVENDLVESLNDLDIRFVSDTVNNSLSNRITPDQLTQGIATIDLDNSAVVTYTTGEADPGLLAELPDVHATHPLSDTVVADAMPGVARVPGYDPVTNPRPGFAGDVVLVPDMDWMDDASFMGTITYDAGGAILFAWPDWPADNENLLMNIVDF